jgi:hypothetical protein
MNAEIEIKQLNDLILQYEEVGDAEKLKARLSDLFIILRSTGLVQDRQQYLDDAPKNANRGRTAENPQVLLAGKAALYTCTITTTQNPDGTPNPGRFWNARLFIQEGGAWRCAAWQAFKVPEPA